MGAPDGENRKLSETSLSRPVGLLIKIAANLGAKPLVGGLGRRSRRRSSKCRRTPPASPLTGVRWKALTENAKQRP